MTPSQIKIALLQRGISQTQIAEKLGLDKRTVNTVINGKGFSTRVANELSRRLEIEPEKLFPDHYEKGKRVA